jgi:hypothetical protein
LQRPAPDAGRARSPRQRQADAQSGHRKRNLVERFFNKIKHYRAVATRYDKRDDNLLASIKLLSIRIWLRFNESVTQYGAPSGLRDVGSLHYQPAPSQSVRFLREATEWRRIAMMRVNSSGPSSNAFGNTSDRSGSVESRKR